MEKLQFIGTDDLDGEEMITLTKLAKKYHENAEKMTKTELGMSVHVKTYQKENSKKKYSVTGKIVGAPTLFRASSSGWKLNDCMHKVGLRLEHEIEHRIKKSSYFSKQQKEKSRQLRKRDS